jgi:hypothetical protein
VLTSDVPFLFRGPDPDCSTYFVRRSERSAAHSDFVLAPEDPSFVVDYLTSRWGSTERAILAPLVAKLLKLAPLFDAQELDPDVSPLIYVMF